MSVLDALVRQYERLHARGEAPPYGFSRESIAYTLVLSDEGEVVTVSALSERSGDAPGRTVCEVPHAVRRTSRPVANFLWDKTGYVFGVKRDPAIGRPCPAHREHHAFRELHERLLSKTVDEGLRALLRFLFAWEPSNYDALPHAESMLGLNVVFRLDGDRQWLHEHPEAKLAWAEHLARTMPAHGTCLVTGAQDPIALVHPVVKGVRGTHAAGAALVTFNLDTFESYGKTRGANAPISIQAAFAYTTALNALLATQSRRRVRIGDMTVVFWADVTDDVDTASQVEALLWHAIVEGESAIAHTLEAIARGEPLTRTTPPVPAGTRLHILGLAASVGRLSVRLWHVDTLGALARRIVEHWTDLRLEPAPWPTPPSARRLLYETARQRKADRIPPALGPALLRAILNGTRYPRTLLAAVIARVRAEKAVTGAQAAICRACLARDYRLGFEREDVPVSLDRDEPHPAYRLGRLFAVYERVQRAALGTVNASIRDRYFGAASSTPATVFPLLTRKYVHHITSLRRREKSRRLAHWYEREIDAILDGVGTAFPRSLRLADQGRFALGYYHQRTWKREAGQAADPAADGSGAEEG